jgi:hypothetical protein
MSKSNPLQIFSTWGLLSWKHRYYYGYHASLLICTKIDLLGLEIEVQ